MNGNVEISWPAEGSEGFSLYANADLNTSVWNPVLDTPVIEGGRHVVTISNPTGNNFYRLQK